MAYWKISHEEREKHEKLSAAARLLYYDAGAWAMQQVFDKRVPLPDQWFIPAAEVRKWGKKNAATTLVREGLWERTQRDGVQGFVFVQHCLAFGNTPEYLAQQRDLQRDAQRRKRGVVNHDKG
ncbi:hypothetical protein [Mycolicibacterium fortuitum]|uniref:Uncharacterized protein n=1 Tax=Mycolicibacterium fortuitum TaxID=1766 RepID=A0AAE4V8H0_MYCFO|nr:hypothetical protein [Mycolicibacterium fortuitum]MCV7141402.1 hypothetical protein [Mycolicibacterium fortuitum]MDV7189598.1 hypothetical protein [Mycolicibacterium fortuitum]MDV7203105.1 hypothetical protein [Mycolicibacterium fortuitum]MDV7224679.1 hypothetical protein [Mycolicibacterium fortuitum]MDV7256801.1 hypothetical protein [Mycolicibacterium fortuitum]